MLRVVKHSAFTGNHPLPPLIVDLSKHCVSTGVALFCVEDEQLAKVREGEKRNG